MNILDIIIVAPILLGFVFGLFKGLVRELMALVSIVLGIWGARLLEPRVSPWLVTAFDLQSGVAQALSYLVLFVLIILILLTLARMLDRLFSALALGGLNKVLGGLFGALKLALIVSVLINVFDTFDRRFSILKKETKRESPAYEGMLHFAPRLWDEAKDAWSEYERKQERTDETRPAFAERIC